MNAHGRARSVYDAPAEELLMRESVKHYERPVFRLPTQSELEDSDDLERCPHCMIVWPSGMMTTEDGVRVCPNGASPTSVPSYMAAVKAAVASEAERYIARPHISQARMVPAIPPTIDTIAVMSTGEAIYTGNPVRIARGSVITLTIKGSKLSASDTYEFPSNIAGIPTVIDETEVSLAITVGMLATVGKHNMEFNDRIIRGIILVR